MLPKVYDGSGQPVLERIALRAGKLTLDYEAGTLRYIRLGTHEVVRGIYAAVRDHNWGTVPAQLRDVQMDIQPDSFVIRFTSDHQQGDVHFSWQGTITGTADSAIVFTHEGEALSRFQYNRIGFCVMHPMDVAGQPLTIEHTDGSLEAGEFPRLIAPHQPFFDVRAITHQVMPGVQAEVRMEGDTFELEDQRNWIDASFKSYCTPLSLPYPFQADVHTAIRQSISVRLTGDMAHVQVRQDAPTLHLDATAALAIPSLGLCAASHDEPLSARQWARLNALHLSHIRIDWPETPAQDVTGDTQARSVSQHAAAPTLLELAVHLGSDPVEDVTHHRQTAEADALGIRRWLLYRQPTTAWERIAAASELLKAGDTPVVGVGTDGYFAQLNRKRPSGFEPDLIAYSVNPQVHAFDNASLIETLAGMVATVDTAKALFPTAKIAVTPITFKISYNPDATTPEVPAPPGQLPRRVDVRQMSLFGAGWTMGAIAAFASAGADSLTFFETSGWLGVMERESGAPLPDLFPSIPGGVFPIYHIFAHLGEFVGGRVLKFESSHPLTFSGLALTDQARTCLLIANHTQQRRTVAITGISGSWMMRSLDETNVEFATREPEAYRAQPGIPVTTEEAGLWLELLPYAVVRLDQEQTS